MRSFHALMLVVFALTLFTSATLLFMIQPLVGKMMLPLLGGTPEVWNTCMVFFQAVLLAGYAYAHATTSWLGVRRQAAVHLTVLLLPLLLFFFVSPLEINKQMIRGGDASPVVEVLLVLLVSVGLPFFVVSTSAPLLQKWFSSTNHPSAHDPYFLYGASNFGSMLALLGYPLFIEPNLRVINQRLIWAGGYGLLVLTIAGCVGLLWVCPPAKKEEEPKDAPPSDGAGAGSTGIASREATERVSVRPEDVVAPVMALEAAETLPAAARRAGDPHAIPLARKLRWVLLGAVPVSLLMGVTTYITTDIAAVPLLWIPPLALYLFTFIVVFASPAFQKVLMALYLMAHVLIIPYLTMPLGENSLPEMSSASWAVWLTALAACWAVVALPTRGDTIRRGMILLLPLLILVAVFVMLSETRRAVFWNILLQLETLFVATMVCHGELARDRPSPKHLTEFFMLMSVGGVVGGIFNALFAPLAFNSLAEYPVALVAVCLFLPPVLKSVRPGEGRSTPADVTADRVMSAGLWVDLILTVVFLVVGGLLIGLRIGENDLDLSLLGRNFSFWMGAVLVAAVVYGVVHTWPALVHLNLLGAFAVLVVGASVIFGVAVDRNLSLDNPLTWLGVLVLGVGAANGIGLGLFGGRRTDPGAVERRRDLAARLLDGLLPFSLGVLTVGLIWGIPSRAVFRHLVVLSQLQQQLNILELPRLLAFGVPPVLCYALIERSRRFGLGVAALLFAGTFCSLVDPDLVLQRRSFFGVLRVERQGPIPLSDGTTVPLFSALVHGTTLHGRQFSREYLEAARQTEEESHSPVAQDVPLTYFHRTGPLGQVFRTWSPEGMPTQHLPRIGVIGLGTGTTARYGQAGQHMTYYDIDRLVKEIAWDTDQYFRYISDARARGVLGIGPDDLKLNDARLAIEREVENLPEEERYGILIVDAFSSDAIPVHLITKEALLLFKRRIKKDDGLICFHISNRYLDLKPVLANLARDPEVHLHGLFQEDGEGRYPGKAASAWVVLCASKERLNQLKYQERDFDALFDGLYGRVDALEKDLERLEAGGPEVLTEKDLLTLLALKEEELRELEDQAESERKRRELDALRERTRSRKGATEQDRKDLFELQEREYKVLFAGWQMGKQRLAAQLNQPPANLPRTLDKVFPRVSEFAYPLALLPNTPPPVQLTGFVLAHQLDVSIWYDLERAADPAVGVWTDDYASVLSVFTPLKRWRQRK